MITSHNPNIQITSAIPPFPSAALSKIAHTNHRHTQITYACSYVLYDCVMNSDFWEAKIDLIRRFMVFRGSERIASSYAYDVQHIKYLQRLMINCSAQWSDRQTVERCLSYSN